MILQCPECSARFAVPDALIPPEGRTVKCGRCAHQWHTDPEPGHEATDFAALAQAATMEDVPHNPSQLPVPQKPPMRSTPFIAGTLALAATWLIVAFMAYFPGWMNLAGLRGVYGMFGITTTDGLVFEDVSMQRDTVDSKTRFVLSGSIANHAAEARTVPTVRVQLRNADNDVLWAREYAVNEVLEAGKPYAFRIDNVETSFADSVSSIVLDVGHPLQLMMR